MTRHTIILNSDQVRWLQSAGRVIVRAPIKYPIHSSWTLATVLLDGRAVFDELYGYDVHYLICPYTPGSVLRVREAWRTEELPSGLDGI